MSCHIPYLSKHTLYDCTFCCTNSKWWHLQMLFSFFQNFSFLGSKGAVEVVQRAKNGPKWQKNSVFISQELYHIWLWFLVHMCKMMISPAIFFVFWKVCSFWVSQRCGVSHFSPMCVIFFKKRLTLSHNNFYFLLLDINPGYSDLQKSIYKN